MQPPKSAVGSVAMGLGVLAAGTFVGAYIGSKALPVGNRFGAMQGGYLGAIATSTAAAIVAFESPEWARVAGLTAITGLSAFLIANVASVIQTNRSFASLDSIMPGLTAAAAGEEPTLPSAPVAQPNVVTLGTDNTNQTVAVHVGDTLVLTLPQTAGLGWFYVAQTSTALQYVNRAPASAATETDTWKAVVAGTYKLDVQQLPVDANGNPTSNTADSELVYNITVS